MLWWFPPFHLHCLYLKCAAFHPHCPFSSWNQITAVLTYLLPRHMCMYESHKHQICICFSSLSCLFKEVMCVCCHLCWQQRANTADIQLYVCLIAHSSHWQVLLYRVYICVIECICSYTVCMCVVLLYKYTLMIKLCVVWSSKNPLICKPRTV